MKTNIFWEHEIPGNEQTPHCYPSDWKYEFGDLPDFFECHRLEKGDILTLVVHDNTTSEYYYTVEVSRVEITIESASSREDCCIQDVWVTDKGPK